MPMDSLMGYRPETSDEAFKRRCIGWELKYSLLPRRCSYSNKLIWFKKAFKGTSMLTGPGDAIFEYRWCDTKEYLFLKLKGII